MAACTTRTCPGFSRYPIVGAIVSRLTGLDVELALPLAAQLCCWGYWTYLVLLCRHWGFSPRATHILIAVLAKKVSCIDLPRRGLFGITVFDGHTRLHLLDVENWPVGTVTGHDSRCRHDGYAPGRFALGDLSTGARIAPGLMGRTWPAGRGGTAGSPASSPWRRFLGGGCGVLRVLSFPLRSLGSVHARAAKRLERTTCLEFAPYVSFPSRMLAFAHGASPPSKLS